MTRYIFFFFYINQDITSRVEIEMSEEIIVEDPAPIIGSTCVSSAMVPKIVKKWLNNLIKIKSIFKVSDLPSDWKTVWLEVWWAELKEGSEETKMEMSHEKLKKITHW